MAIADWEEAVRLAPDNTKFRKNLAAAQAYAAKKAAKAKQDANRYNTI